MTESNPEAAAIHRAFRALEGDHGPEATRERHRLWDKLENIRRREAKQAEADEAQALIVRWGPDTWPDPAGRGCACGCGRTIRDRRRNVRWFSPRHADYFRRYGRPYP